MHVDRTLRVTPTGEEAEDGPEDFDNETVPEVRETALVNLGRQKWQDKKLSGYLFPFIML